MGLFENKNRFSLGEITTSLCYRTETEIPAKGVKYLENAFISPSAGLKNFPKLIKIGNIDLKGVQAFRLVKYKINKKDTNLTGYIFLYTDKKVLVLRMDNFNIVGEVPTAYTVEEIENLSITQFENAVISCVENKEPVMVRVDEKEVTFKVVEYWKNIQNPPTKRVESDYQYLDDDKQVFLWYKSGSKVIFESTISSSVYKPSFFDNMIKGIVSIYGGDFTIEKIENKEGKQKITTTQLNEPNIDVPESSAEEAEKKINILDLVFQENLFNKGYPAVVTEYKGRVIFGNVAGNPSCIVASRVFDSLNFRQSLEDNDGFTTFITGNELNTIKDFMTYKSLMAITDKGIFSTQLNTALTTKNSEFYDQKLPRPKGLTYWCESDDAVYYIDTTDRIYQIQDMGSDDAYRIQEVSAYSGHLFKDLKDIYFFKYDKQNMIGVDSENGARVLSYNYEENIMCWSRIPRLEGINEYINIDDNLYLFNATENGIGIWKLSETEVEPIKLILPPSSLSTKYGLGYPEYLDKKVRIEKVEILVLGNYSLKVNGKKKEITTLNQEIKPFEDNIHIVEFPNLGGKVLEVEQVNDEKLEILGIFYSKNNVGKG